MKGLGVTAAAAAVAILGGAGAANAADLGPYPVKALPAAPATCTSIMDFFSTACQLSAYGVRIYGTVDVGFGYQTHGAPFDKDFVTGASYFIQKMNRSAMWSLAPNGLGNSNIGVQIKEPLGGGWSFIGDLQAGFDPYSLQLSSSPGSLGNNIGVTLSQQTTNGDSSRAGQFYNGLGYFGFSNDTYGTLTFFRQNALTNDGVTAYDPMGGAYAFSPIGFSGIVAGGGATEDAKYSTSAKYRVNIGNFRIGALAAFGGYDMNNGAKEAYQGQIGGDFHVGPGLLSTDVIAGYNKDAVALGFATTGAFPNVVPTGLKATISDNTNVMVLAKYTLDRLKLYAGYEWMQFAKPSDLSTTPFTDIAGQFVGTVSTSDYLAKDRILQVVWAGARYSVTDTVDVVAAYYHYDQNNFTTGAAAGTCSNTPSLQNSGCAGTMNAASFLIDWKFAPKWDTYIGTFYSEMNGGLDSGYLSRNNLATTAGVRFRF
jgi:predicted porin